MKFLCDRMLGTLAKWLRIYGFDTYYATSDISDDKLLNIAKKENLVLITRDKNLVYRARRQIINFIEIKSTDLDEQLSTVLKGCAISEDNVLTRCLLCNSTLNDIDKKEVKDNVSERVFNSNEKFWFCNKCKKIYWKGSHYDKMLEKMNSIRQ
jgi:uncharacterized protein with PIN domain